MGMEARAYGTDPQPGDLVAGKYRIERVIGHGGMGRVLAARHTATGKKVALKWVLNQESAEIRERFAREARAAGRIHHANVVDVYDVLEHEGATCLVMELLRGESLASYLEREQRLPPEVAIPLAIQVARGLHAAHEEGVIHRDLKPANLFVTEGHGEPGLKILDFGISKIIGADESERVTKTGAVMGTPHYMAPEQVLGHDDLDHRVDVYALGAVLYEMLSGVPPHDHEKVTALLVQIATEPTIPVGVRVPELPTALSDVIMKALAKKRDDRYASVAELATALEPFASGTRFSSASGRYRPPVLEQADRPGAHTPSRISTQLAPTVARAARSEPSEASAADRLEPEAVLPRPAEEAPGSKARRYAVVGGLAVTLAALLGWAVTRPAGEAAPDGPATDAPPATELRAPATSSPPRDEAAEQPEQAQPEQAQPEQAQPEQAQPEQAQPEQAQPEQAQPEPAQPEQAQPERAPTPEQAGAGAAPRTRRARAGRPTAPPEPEPPVVEAAEPPPTEPPTAETRRPGGEPPPEPRRVPTQTPRAGTIDLSDF